MNIKDLAPGSYKILPTSTPLNIKDLAPGSFKRLDQSQAALAQSQKTADQLRMEKAQGGTDTSFGDIPGNVLPSVGKAAGGIFDAITHPISTLKGVGQTIVGGVSKLGRALGTGANVDKPATEEEQTFDTVAQFFKDRYGTPEDLKKTLVNDPAGIALDLSTFLTGGAGVAGKTGTVGKVLKTAGEVTNPVNVGGKVVGAVGKKAGEGAGNVAAQGLGFTTGAGAEAIKEAFRNPGPEFTSALRGKTKGKDIVQTARQALNDVEDKRGLQYRTQLAEISKQGDSLDISPLHKELDSQLQKFGITQDETGKLDFERSALTKGEATQAVEDLAETLKEWGARPGDRTPEKLDILKRRLGDYNLESGQARAIVSALQNKVKEILNEQVPGYKDMTSNYAQASEFINELDSTLALSNGNRTETAITKLTQTLKNDKDYRQALVKQLEESTGTSIKPQIAGAALKSWLPRGLAEKLFAGGAIGSTLLTPQFMIGLLTATASLSPRLVGEFARGLGIANNKVKDVITAVDAIRKKVPGIDKMTPDELEKVLFQAERTNEESE